MNLPRWSLRNPITAGMVLLSVVVLGALSAPRLPLAFLPEVEFPGLEVTIPYPNSLPAQVEEEITRPAEEALSTLSRVRRITSSSSANQANIYVQFDWGEDIGPLRVEAREKLDRIRDQLPADVDVIQINSQRSSDIPVLECRVSAGRDLSNDYELLNRHIADPLRRVPGVAKVELYGVEPPQVRVDFQLAGLERHRLSAGEVLDRVEAASRSQSAGRLHPGDETWPLRVVNQFASLEEIRALPLDARGLKLGDVATVAMAEPDLDYGRHLDEARAIGLNVIKESGANTVEVARRARKVLEEIGRDPQLQGIRVLTFTDQGDEIENSISGLLKSGMIGGALAIVILFVFLRSWVTTLVVGLAIPFSLLAAAALLHFTGRTLNILSMMGLMLAVGMLVDNAVVVLESIFRHRQRGLGALRASLVGSREVTAAVVCSTATSIIVFLPLVLGGRTEISTWIGEVGRTIIFTLLCSLFLSLTAIPLALGRVLPARPVPHTRLVAAIASFHQRVLHWTLAHRPATVGIALLVVVSAGLAFTRVDKSAFTASKVEAVRLEYEFADNLNHGEVERVVAKMERWMTARKDSLHLKYTYSYFTNNYAFTRAYMLPAYANDEGASKVRKLLRERLPELAGVKIKFDDREGGGNSGPSQVSVRVFGPPGERLEELAAEVARRMGLVPDVSDVNVGGQKGSQELELVVDRDRAARCGLPTSQVAGAVALFFRGRPLARYRGPEGEVQVVARLSAEDRSSRERLRELTLASAGGPVPLGAVTDFRVVRTPQSIERQQRHSVRTVNASCDPKKAGQTRKNISRELNAMSLPTGYWWSYGQGFEEEDATQKEMLVNLLLALMLVYLVMASLFESLLHPFAIMLALPFAFVGIAWMCLLTGSPFNIMAQIGLLILVGIVVNNGIVLIYHVHQLRERGFDRRHAILDASRDRLRPILMTTLTTILGLFPLAFGREHVGDVLYFPLARTVIGGLAAATVLTLVLVPCLYTLLEDGAQLIGRVWKLGPGRA
ncbi:MAG TPA: efflux RND transporter permease subunit [Candidatus Eisenbacteria bacterium]|jgi:HAE1 family hydrophobic/amphiphilic exporter-1